MMKRFFAALLLVTAIFSSQELNAQLRKVPVEVTDDFKTKFPDASNLEWKDRFSSVEANFKIAETAYKARFNKNGEWMETEKIIEPAVLPAAVKDGFDKSKYTSWEVKELSHLEKKDSAFYR